MRNRLSLTVSGAAILVALTAAPSLAEEKIQAIVAENGRIVFTNLVDNTPAPPPPVLVEKNDVLAQEMPPTLLSLVDTISTNHGIDPALVRAVIKTESNFNRWAVSNKGARGLMQLIPETGARYGVRDFFDPQQNVEGGVQYLKFLLEKFNGNLNHFCLVVAAENFAGAIDDLKDNQIAIREGPVSRWGARGRATSVYFLDPDGNEIEIRCY